MTTMRSRFAAVASDLIDASDRIVAVLADIGVGDFDRAVRRHPDRVVNVGIREQLMLGVAAGFALEGRRPIVHSYAPFLVERAYEQIKLDLVHQGVGAILVSVGGSYDASAEGRTHQSPEDVAILRALPGIAIHVPGHPDELETLLRHAAAAEGTAYFRLAADANRQPRPVRPGSFDLVRTGSPHAVTVVAVGSMLDPVMRATEDVDATILYAATVRPFDHDALRTHARSGDVVLVEPYLAGTSAAEVDVALIDLPHRLLALGVSNVEHRRYGTRHEHAAEHGLDAAGIRRSILRFARASAGPCLSAHVA